MTVEMRKRLLSLEHDLINLILIPPNNNM